MKLCKLVLAIVVMMPLVARADTILLRGKAAITGVKVTAETMKEVTYTKSGKSKKTVPTSEVIAVIYDRPPVNYRLGQERFSLGDFVNAVARLKPAVDEGASDQPWVKIYASFYLGRAHLAHGDFRDGVKVLKKLLSQISDHRLYPHVAIALARCQSMDALHADAKKTLTKLKNVLEQQGVKGELPQRANLALGDSYMAAAKYSLAADTYKEVAAAGVGSKGILEELGYHAKGRLLQADLLNKDVPKAKIVLDDLRSASRKNISAASAAYRDAKVAMLLHGDGSGQTPNTKELLEAVYDLSRVRGENFGVISELPRNCYLLGLIHLKLEGSLTGAKELAKGYFEETRKLYPESREAFLAREELKKM